MKTGFKFPVLRFIYIKIEENLLKIFILTN